MTGSPLRVGFIGWGAIARSAYHWLSEPGVDVVAVAVRNAATSRPDLPAGAHVISDPAELQALELDVVAEAAGRESVGPWGRAALAAGADLIVSSVSAFADAELLSSLRACAVENGAHILIQPGALAGVEALAAATTMGVEEVEHRIVKPPRAWKGTPAETLCDLDNLTSPTVFFAANAADTASQFPKNANVAMTSALAGVGPEATKISLVADPFATKNRHELSAHGAFGHLEVALANSPLPENPKSSAMAALSLVRALQNRVAAIAI